MKYNQPYGVSDPNAPYINGNPSTGTMGSIPPAASIEHPQREIANFITDSGFTPNEADLRQLGKGVQGQKVVYATDFGIPNSYLINVVPALTAYAAGQRWNVRIINANTGPATININSLGPRPITMSGGAPLKGNEMQAGAVVGLIDDGVRLQIQGGPGAGHPVLLAPLNYYVNVTTGSDTLYDGTSATVVGGTSNGPFKQVQRALHAALTWNMNNQTITINVADGTYLPFVCTTPNGSGTIDVRGNLTTPANVLIQATTGEAIFVTSDNYYIRGFRVQSNGDGVAPHKGCGIRVLGGLTRVQNIDFDVCFYAHMMVQSTSTLVLLGTESGDSGAFINVTGNAPYHMVSAQNSLLYLSLPVLNITGSRAITTWAAAHTLGVIDNRYASIVGANTGTRYFAHLNGIINTAGAGANYYPGTIVGTTATGGQYA